MQTYEKKTQLGNYVFVLSPLSCARACNKVGVHTSIDVPIISMALLILNSQPRHAPSLCMWAVKALAIFPRCAGLSEPSLLAYAVGTIIS